jgi:hypothetical protein
MLRDMILDSAYTTAAPGLDVGPFSNHHIVTDAYQNVMSQSFALAVHGILYMR